MAERWAVAEHKTGEKQNVWGEILQIFTDARMHMAGAAIHNEETNTIEVVNTDYTITVYKNQSSASLAYIALSV